MNDSNRLTRLEETVTHLQRHITEQDKVMLALADEVARLRQEFAKVRAQPETSEPGDASGDERPPHY